jgi:hypothetical protein
MASSQAFKSSKLFEHDSKYDNDNKKFNILSGAYILEKYSNNGRLH